MKLAQVLMVGCISLGLSQAATGQQEQVYMVSIGAYAVSNGDVVVLGQSDSPIHPLPYFVVISHRSHFHEVGPLNFPVVGNANINLDHAGARPAFFTAEIRKTADANGDGAVDFTDFLILSANFGLPNPNGYDDADFDLDGDVDFVDFLLLSEYFGT